eukprot:TRINITY_DN18295_c0_g1_i1.p1 TRINITY_DN18295_c0_g1~~TRINITY_DN18295_c0_g1_i1.p1  ORF type:complete len:117 (-),score=24.53 TRINITY_DN18295_c0_g1_i1:203-553(-)
MSNPGKGKWLRAIYAYKKAFDDELSFEEGDRIKFISTESKDEGWWRGELNGVEGMVPSNYVEFIKDDSGSNLTKSSVSYEPSNRSSRLSFSEILLEEKRMNPPPKTSCCSCLSFFF